MTDLLRRYRYIRRAIPYVFVLWTILMLVLTLIPSETMPDVKLFSFDKLGHLGMFGGWTFFLGLYVIVYKEKIEINLVLLLLAGIIFGGLIELMQHLLTGDRTASLGDFTANTLGCIVAYLLLHPVKRYLKRGK